MIINATLHTTQNLGDHRREIDIDFGVDPHEPVRTLIERISEHCVTQLDAGFDYITLTVVQ